MSSAGRATQNGPRAEITPRRAPHRLRTVAAAVPPASDRHGTARARLHRAVRIRRRNTLRLDRGAYAEGLRGLRRRDDVDLTRIAADLELAFAEDDLHLAVRRRELHLQRLGANDRAVFYRPG